MGLSSVLVDDHERQHSGSVPFGLVHPQVKAGFESPLADLLPLIGRRYVFGMPDFTTMPAAATNGWMSSAFPGFVVTLPDV